MTKPADSDQIANARRWLNSKHFTADSGVTLDCLAMLPDEHVIALNIRQLAQLMGAFAASERQAVIEDCCRAVCNRCARPDKYEFFNCETRKHRLFDSGELFECRAAEIRSME